jgi:hypothetical protein
VKKMRVDKYGQLRTPESDQDLKENFTSNDRLTVRPMFFVVALLLVVVALIASHFLVKSP